MNAGDERYLTAGEERLLLEIARDTVEAWVRQRQRLELADYTLTPALLERHGAFVTLTNHGELRGCVGYAANRAPLGEAVRDNAINASSRDARFAPVTADELEDIRIEVSALTPGDTPESPFKLIGDPREIVIGRDGLCIQFDGARTGLLLPQVPGHHGWNVEQFLVAVCRKAQLPDDAWRDPRATLFRFSAQVFSEPE